MTFDLINIWSNPYCILDQNLVVIGLQLFKGDPNNENLTKLEHTHTHTYTTRRNSLSQYPPTSFQVRGIKRTVARLSISGLTFPQFSPFFYYFLPFFLNFSSFSSSILVLTREGPGYTTGECKIHRLSSANFGSAKIAGLRRAMEETIAIQSRTHNGYAHYKIGVLTCLDINIKDMSCKNMSTTMENINNALKRQSLRQC